MTHNINIAIAKHQGMWIYHYDKDYETSCYYILVDKNFDAVVWDGKGKTHAERTGERKTFEEAIKDVPDWYNDLPLAMNLFNKLIDSRAASALRVKLYGRIEAIPGAGWSVTIKRSKRGKTLAIAQYHERLEHAICQVYCDLYGIDTDVTHELAVD